MSGHPSPGIRFIWLAPGQAVMIGKPKQNLGNSHTMTVILEKTNKQKNPPKKHFFILHMVSI